MKCSELLRLLKKHGWNVVRQSGSHIILRHNEISGTITIPFHSSSELKKGLLIAILKKAKIKTDKR